MAIHEEYVSATDEHKSVVRDVARATLGPGHYSRQSAAEQRAAPDDGTHERDQPEECDHRCDRRQCPERDDGGAPDIAVSARLPALDIPRRGVRIDTESSRKLTALAVGGIRRIVFPDG